MDKRDMPGLLVAIAGILMIIIFAGGDIFHIGKSAGFGSFQILGCLAGALTILAGALLIPRFRQKLASSKAGVCLLILGAVILIAAFFADPIGVGIYPKFGIMQIVGVLLGGCAMIFGGMQLRSKKQPETETSDNNL